MTRIANLAATVVLVPVLVIWAFCLAALRDD